MPTTTHPAVGQLHQRLGLAVALAILLQTPLLAQARPAGTPPPQSTYVSALEANKALVQSYFKALETGDIAVRNALVDPDGRRHDLTGTKTLGAAKQSITEVCPTCAVLPDLKIRIDSMVAEGDLVIGRSAWIGTYTGTYRGMAILTPKPVTVNYVNTYRIANGRIVESWVSSDRLALAEQLGFGLNVGQVPNLVRPELETVVTQSHEALRLILNGDPSGYAALFADREDITLGNPFGPFGKGRAAVLAALNNAAKKYTDGSVVRVERVAVYGGGNHVVLVEIEHDRAKLGTATDFAEFAARVTSVYEKIGGTWKLVHRHADPITSARPAESMLPGPAPQGIVGTWRLVKFEDVEGGKIIRRFGDKPSGLFVYTADGHVIIQITNPANPACVTQGKKSLPGRVDDIALTVCNSKQFEALLDGTVAYWGTYTIDLAKGVVIHNVVSDVANGYAGTAQPRQFRLDGDRLMIGDGKTSTRVLERVRR